MTQTEEVVLRVLIDPENLGMTREERRLTTGRLRDNGKDVTKSTWNRINSDQWFRERVADASIKALQEHLPDLLSASITSAKRPDAGFNDRKMLLEIAGVYQPRINTHLSGKAEITQKQELQIGDRLTAALVRAAEDRQLLVAKRNDDGTYSVDAVAGEPGNDGEPAAQNAPAQDIERAA